MAKAALMAQKEESRIFRRFLRSFEPRDRDALLARYPVVAGYLQVMFGHAGVDANLQDLAVFLEDGHLPPLPPDVGRVSDQARRDAFSSLMVHLQQNDVYLALDRFLQYLFGLEDNIIKQYLMSDDYDGIDPGVLKEWYGGREDYMDLFLSRTLRASMIPDDVEEILGDGRRIVHPGAREGFRRLEAAFIAFDIYHPAQVQQNALLTSDSSNDEDEDDKW